MKTAIALVIMLLSASFINRAESCEKPEAQFIASVAKIESLPNGTCLVRLNQVRHFMSHGLCPLFLEEVLHEGVTMEVDQCREDVKVGEEISGILFRSENQTIQWEF